MKQNLFMFLFFALFSPGALFSGMPPVADVFKGMSEDEIIKQVQEAEKFLKDLQEFGTPEEQAEFNKILEATLGSMSEQDFQDITDIAKMVEPHLQPEAAVKVPVSEPSVSKPKEDSIQKASESALENFKTLITSIISRLDEILQKFDSSKACKEEVDTRWKNRATLNSMKRQIAQLKITRLAEKLSKKDLSEDEKSLVDALEKFLKEITSKNNNLVIEDSFGFETKEEESKYLKQAKSIINILDEYIDTLMPMLEKFLTKWDPEALQLAKEAADRTSKAHKEAQDAMTRKPSQAASPAQKSSYPVQSGSGKNYGVGSSQGYYPDYYDQHGYPQADGYYNNKGNSTQSPQGNAGSNAPISKGQSPAQQINQKLKSQNTNIVDDFKEAIDSYFEKYDNNSAGSNMNFLNEKVNGGYTTLNKQLTDALVKPAGPANVNPKNSLKENEFAANIEGFTNWYEKKWLPYTNDIVKSLEVDQKKFIHELKSAPRLCEDIHSAIHDMTAEEVKKTTVHLDRLEDRFKSYRDAFDKSIDNMNTTFQNNLLTLNDPNVIPVRTDTQQTNRTYSKDHESFVAKLRSDIGDKINVVLSHIDDLKSKVRHKSKRKSKSSAITQSMQQAAQPVAA